MIEPLDTGLAGAGRAIRPSVVVADARCLQDPDYAPRGVGRHALALVQGFPRDRGTALVALADPALPPMAPQTAALFDTVAATPYAAQRSAERLGTLAAYVVLSPMTHDPLYGARFLQNRFLARTAVVYDFIPLRYPDRYLRAPEADLGYALRLFWLRQCDRFVPISQSAADDLVEHLRVGPDAIRVSGAPLAEAYAEDRTAWAGSERAGILVVGGGDPRKSPETVVRAHASNATLQRARTVLTVAGNYGRDQRTAFKALSAATGGDPDLVDVPGHVGEPDLVALYRTARVVVCASVDEGFSLPLVEGMAAGAVVLASDIPAHRELVPSAGQLFPVGDAERLSDLLDTAAGDGPATEATIRAQDGVWPRFRAAQVAARFWDHAVPVPAPIPGPAGPAVHRGAKPKVAVLSPLPPDRSGVADYTHATCLELAKRVDLSLFSETAGPNPLPGAAAILPLTDLPGLSPRYDRTVSVLGNSHFHLSILEHLERYGGASIAHDARMLSFYYFFHGHAATAAMASRELGRHVSVEEVAGWVADEGTMQTTFLSAIAAASTPMMVHSPVTQAMLRAQAGVEAVHLPFCIYHPFDDATLTPAHRRAARARLGIEPDEVVLATFGFVDRVKAPEECLWALRLLRRWNIDASLHFVGQYTDGDGSQTILTDAAARLGVAGHVRFFPDFLGKGVYKDYLLAADVAIQLRTYGLGGLSGALLDCAAAGLPCVANQSLFDAVAPPAALTSAIPDALSPVLLAEQVASAVRRRGTGALEDARQEFCRERSLARYADHLMAALDLAP